MRSLALPVLAGDPFAGHALGVHDTLAGLDDAWRQAAQEGGGYVFQTWEWNSIWQDAIGRVQGVQPRIVELRDPGGRIVALWPLGIYRRQGLRVLNFLGDLVSDYRMPILLPEFVQAVPPEAFGALWQAIVRGIPGVDYVAFRRMPERLEGPDAPINPMTRLAGARHTENAYAASLPDTPEAFRKRLSRNLVPLLRRRLRQLQEVAPVRISTRDEPQDQPATMRVLAEQKSRRWQESGSPDMFAEPGYLDFYRGMAFEPGTGAEVVVSSLHAGDAVVATHWGLAYRGRYYWILPTYAGGEWLRYSCGRTLMTAVIDRAIADRFAIFDMTAGDEDYKKQWADHTLSLYEWRQAVTLPGRAVLALQDLKAWARGKPALRRLVQRLKGRRPDKAAPPPATAPAEAPPS